MTTPTLLLPELIANQSQPHVPINAALQALDWQVHLSVIDLLDTPPGSPTAGDRYIVIATGTGDFATHEDDVAYYTGTAWTFYTPEPGWSAYVTGLSARYEFGNASSPASWSEVAGAAAPTASLGMFFPGVPGNAALMFKFVASAAMTFPANFSGSVGHIGTNPTSTTALDVQVNGSTIGAISISTGGTFTFTTSGGTEKAVSSGQRIEIYNQGTADATAADIAATLVATL